MDGMDLPFLIPPFPYGHVEENVYRGGYPKLRNLRFLKRLKLKTIVSLTPDPINYDAFTNFCKEQDIKNIHIRVAKPKDSLPLTYSKVAQVIQLIIDPNNLPIYVHCLDGTIITGVIFMCFRKLQLWATHSIQIEYIRYTRDDDIGSEEVEFLEKYNGEIEIPEQIPKWLWNGQIPFKKHPTMKIRFARIGEQENNKGQSTNTNNQIESQSSNNSIIKKENNSLINIHNNYMSNSKDGQDKGLTNDTLNSDNSKNNNDSNDKNSNNNSNDNINNINNNTNSSSNSDLINNNNEKYSKSSSRAESASNNKDNKDVIEDQFTEAIRKRIDEEILAIRKSSKYGATFDDHSSKTFTRNNIKSISTKVGSDNDKMANRRNNQKYLRNESETREGFSTNNTNSEYESNDESYDSYSNPPDESDEDFSENDNNEGSVYNDMNDDDEDEDDNKDEDEDKYNDYNDEDDNEKNYGINDVKKISMTIKALNLEGLNSN